MQIDFKPPKNVLKKINCAVISKSARLVLVYHIRTRLLVSICRTRETGHMARGKICTITSRNISSRVCQVDFDGRREMSSFSLKTVVVHKSVKLLMTETNLQKGGLVHRVPWTKYLEKLQELFQSVCVLFCKYKHCKLF